MSISESPAAVHSLPDPDKLQLVHILAEDLTGRPQSPLERVTGSTPSGRRTAHSPPPTAFSPRYRPMIGH